MTLEFFQDSQGLILVAWVDENRLMIDHLPAFENWNRDLAKYATKVIERSVWEMYPDPRPWMEADDVNLLVAVERCIRERVYLPREELYNALANWVLFTYLYDHPIVIHLPRLTIHGVKKTGKSRLIRLLSFLSYRGYYCTGPTEAVLFRLIEKLRVTPCIDEIQRLQKEQCQGVEEILVAGFDRGGTVPRASTESEWPIIYRIDAPVCAGGMKWHPPDEVVERSVKVEMIKKPANVKLRRLGTVEEFQELRGRLLAFRLRALSGELPIEEAVGRLEEVIEGGVGAEGEVVHLDDRGFDIAAALAIPGMLFDDYGDTLREIARTQAKAIDTTRGTFEADVLNALLRVIEDGRKTDLGGNFRPPDPRRISTRDITNQLNTELEQSGNAPKSRVHTRAVTRIIGDTFGFDLLVGGGVGRTTVFDPRGFWERLDRVLDSFGYSGEERGRLIKGG